ncbi:MAG: arylsulfatase [Opitutus sp.]|nr:arylsulfatase [Opitutus sp.]
MPNRSFDHFLLPLYLIAGLIVPDRTLSGAELAAPNIVVILTDDQGYADVGVFGAKGFTTPRLDRMAREGMKFTQCYAGAAACSASRASLLTGCYAQRISIPAVIGDKSGIGLHPAETTIAGLLKTRGYATAIVGKWHLGQQLELLPLRRGFDEFLGTPYSNDTGPDMSEAARLAGRTGLPMIEGDRVIETNPDQRYLTRRYTERAVDFIARHQDGPFFLYLAHNMPHTPLFVSERFKGTTARGLYGDVIAELDWSVGRVLDALRENGLEERTLVVFMSDNGPWHLFGDHGGSAAPLRGGKKQTFDGGMRVPCLMRWPGRIPAQSVCHELVASFDLLPTVAKLAGAALPERRIDGLDIGPLIFGREGAASPHPCFYYYWQKELRAVRQGKWKLQFPHVDRETPDPQHAGNGGRRGDTMAVAQPLALYNLVDDVDESTDVAASFPGVVAALSALADVARKDLGDSLQKMTGEGVRPCVDLSGRNPIESRELGAGRKTKS